ncbi:hypothetical protein GJ744_003271 [Endocarpon pusillum]|uniref:Uncharacterized protein n=1 Tax=Endocarpon pusillum TaxID=364733 RepID=A0A8H7AA67_9EURO|nr:hypothetical protein GJ744_003271 [Endocarpon pusillum]
MHVRSSEWDSWIWVRGKNKGKSKELQNDALANIRKRIKTKSPLLQLSNSFSCLSSYSRPDSRNLYLCFCSSMSNDAMICFLIGGFAARMQGTPALE